METAKAMDGSTGLNLGFFSVYCRSSMRKAYCDCGRIVDMDRSHFSMKLSLNKKVECPCCRNARIARERQELDDHFDPPEETDPWFLS